MTVREEYEAYVSSRCDCSQARIFGSAPRRRASRRTAKYRARRSTPRPRQKALHAAPVGQRQRADRERRRDRGDEAAEASAGSAQISSAIDAPCPCATRSRPGLRRRPAVEREQPVVRRGRGAFEEARAERCQFAVERHAGQMRADHRDRDLARPRRGGRRRERRLRCCRSRPAAVSCRHETRGRARRAARRCPPGASSVTPNGMPSARMLAGTARPQRSSRLTKLV